LASHLLNEYDDDDATVCASMAQLGVHSIFPLNYFYY